MENKKISELAKQIRGVSYKPSDLHTKLDSQSVILLRANNISDGLINFDDVVYVDKCKVSQNQYLRDGDILICASSGSKHLVGKAAAFHSQIDCTFGAFCKVVRPHSDLIDYLEVYFQSHIYRKKISEVAMGANINNIRNEHIDALELPVGCPEENATFTKTVHAIMKIIRVRQQQLKKLDELVKSRFIELFGDLTSNAYGWETCTLDECFDITSSKRILKSEWKDQGIPFLRVRDMVQLATTGMMDNEFFVSEEFYESLSDSDGVPAQGDILVSATSTLGKCHVVGNGERFYFKDADVLRFRPQRAINPVFFMEQMKTAYIEEQISRTLGVTTVAHFTIKAAKTISIRYPDLVLQEQFASFVEQTDKSKFVIQQALDKAQLLFDSLMQKYFG